MHAMWKPQKFKYIYLMATLYVFTLTLPSATAVYWAFGDELLNHSNAFSLLPKSRFRDAAVILMLIHQVNFRLHLTCLWKVPIEKIHKNFIFSSENWLGLFCFGVLDEVHYVWVCLYAVVLCVGESDWNAWYEEHLFKGYCEVTGGDSNLVFGNHFPVLWANKFGGGSFVGEFHSIYYPCSGSYADLQKGLCSSGKILSFFFFI